MRRNLRAVLQVCSRRVWFPTALGWVLYGLAVFLGGQTLYPHHSGAFYMAFSILSIMSLLGGVAAHVVGVVRSMRALSRGAALRWESITAAVLSWSGVALALCVALVLVTVLIRIS